MHSIRIKNLRSLIDTEDVEIKPITFIVGSNSSGKSSFLRTFPLLRQSTEANTVGAILWYGTYVDFGTHDEAKNKYSTNNEISFSFTYDLSAKNNINNASYTQNPLHLFNSKYLEDFIPGTYKFTLEVIIDSDSSGQSKTKAIAINFEDHSIQFEIGDFSNGSIEINNIVVNETEIAIEPETFRAYKGNRSFLPLLMPGKNFYGKNIKKIIQKYNSKKVSIAEIDHFYDLLKLGSSEQMLSLIKDVKKDKKIWQKNVQKWELFTPEFIELKNSLLILGLIGIVNASNKYLSSIALQTKYIAPIRAHVDRYYRMQDLAVDEVDFQGQNLAMYLYTLNRDKRKNFKSWAFENFNFSPVVKKTGGHISLFIEFDGKNIVNVADLGFGFSQVLPILVQLWAISNSNVKRSSYSKAPYIFTMEQPELHLHPSMQAQLTDVFVKAVKIAHENLIDLRLIIETHSETMINRLGHLIETRLINSENINVLVFNKKYNDNFTQIEVARYDENGYLQNWPYGFFEPDIDFL